MLDHCVTHGGILALGLLALLLQYAFQSLLVTAGRPNVGLVVTTAAGVANIALDALFILVFGWGCSYSFVNGENR